MRAQGARASPGSPRIQTVIRADPRKADGGHAWAPERLRARPKEGSVNNKNIKALRGAYSMCHWKSIIL
jgi:hypothetical protein